LTLHGAGGDAQSGISHFLHLTDTAWVVLLAPESRGRTWDVLVGGYGPDIEFIDRALEWVFDRLALDTRRLAITGFSDGASYSLPRPHQRGSLHARDRLLAGVHGAGEAQGQAARLRLPRDARSSTFRNYIQSTPGFRALLLTEDGSERLELAEA
jgi:poly(3-hydroxybutyrate) depolymerase